MWEKAIVQKPPKPTTPLRGAAKSFLDYRLSPLKSTLYETCIQININRRIYIGEEKFGVYAQIAYTTPLYMKIEIIIFCSVQIYRILYN